MTGKVTSIIAAASAVSPWWLPTLGEISEAAATWLPILGCLWLVIQMTGYFLKKRKQ